MSSLFSLDVSQSLLAAAFYLSLAGIPIILIRLHRAKFPNLRWIVLCTLLFISMFNIFSLYATVEAMYDGGTSLSLKGDSALILTAMSGTNTKFLEGLREVDVGSLAFLFHPQSQGIYTPTERSIVFRNTEAVTPAVFQHELHHHIWYHVLNETWRDSWRQLYWSCKSPTEYGETAPEEDFADSGMLYFYNEPIDQERQLFFEAMHIHFLDLPPSIYQVVDPSANRSEYAIEYLANAEQGNTDPPEYSGRELDCTLSVVKP